MAGEQEGSVAGSYRLHRRGPVWLGGVVVVLGAVATVLALLDGREAFGSLYALMTLTFLANLLVWRAAQTVVSPEGLRVTNGLCWRTIPWGAVVDIERPGRRGGDRTLRASIRGSKQVTLYVPAAQRDDLLAYAEAHRQPSPPRPSGDADGIR